MKVTIKELTIESDSDFSHVNIDFSKGSVIATPQSPEMFNNSTDTNSADNTVSTKYDKDTKFNDVALNLDEDFSISSEKVEKPVIEEVEREVLVSEDMMNAEF